jgi:hypothetical protein
VCTAHRVRGDRFCKNPLSAPMEVADAAVIEALVAKVLTPDLVDDVVRYAAVLRERTKSTSGRRRIEVEKDLRAVEKELKRYAEAIAANGPMPALLEALRTRDRRRLDLRAELQRLDAATVAPRGEDADLRAKLTRRMADWRATLERHPERARETILRPLLADRIAMKPDVDARTYEFTARLSFGALVTGLIGTGDGRAITVVPPGWSECVPRVPLIGLSSAA